MGSFHPNEVGRIEQHIRERRKEIRKGRRELFQAKMLSMGPWGLRPKKFQTSVGVPPAPVRVPGQRPLAQSFASVKTVANDKGVNEMVPGAVHRFPGLYLTVEEIPGKFQLGDRLMKGLYHQSSP